MCRLGMRYNDQILHGDQTVTVHLSEGSFVRRDICPKSIGIGLGLVLGLGLGFELGLGLG